MHDDALRPETLGRSRGLLDWGNDQSPLLDFDLDLVTFAEAGMFQPAAAEPQKRHHKITVE
mgnify:CR=1 FL=1